MIFFSGSSCIPPVGFDLTPTLLFNEENVFPKAFTCALFLMLPFMYKEYQQLERVTYGLKSHGGFGLM